MDWKGSRWRLWGSPAKQPRRTSRGDVRGSRRNGRRGLYSLHPEQTRVINVKRTETHFRCTMGPHICVGRNLRTGSVCKLRLSVCRLGVLNVQFVDCTRHKPGLQTGIQFANCVNPVCKLGKSSFRGLVCKWVQNKRTFEDDRDRAVHGRERRAEASLHRGSAEAVWGRGQGRSQFLTGASMRKLRCVGGVPGAAILPH